MSATLFVTGPGPTAVQAGPLLKDFDEDELFEFCQLNRDLRIERTAEGDLIIMPPTGGKTGIRNFKLITSFGSWVKRDATGQGFDSSTVFGLPNHAKRSPDVSWVRNERWDSLSELQQKKFPPLCPDFAVELRSDTDSLKALQEKLEEYIENGAQLGWLIDPLEKKVYVYRQGRPVEILNDPQTIAGETLLPGFILDLRELWD